MARIIDLIQSSETDRCMAVDWDKIYRENKKRPLYKKYNNMDLMYFDGKEWVTLNDYQKNILNSEIQEIAISDYLVKIDLGTPLPEPDQKDSLLPSERKYVEDQKKVFRNDVNNTPEAFKLIKYVFKIGIILLFVLATKMAFRTIPVILFGDILDLPPFEYIATWMYVSAILSVSLVVFFNICRGKYDIWIKKNIDPYIINLKTWLNRRNE